MSERIRIALVCSECGARNYQTTRPKSGTKSAVQGGSSERFQIKKHCPGCNRHTVHKESK